MIDEYQQDQLRMELRNDQLRSVSGTHQWINHNEEIRVENALRYSSNLVPEGFTEKLPRLVINHRREDLNRSIQMFDVQLQVTDGQLEPAVRYGIFSLTSLNPMKSLTVNQLSQTDESFEPEMDMEHGDHWRGSNYRNGHPDSSNNQRQHPRRSNSGSSGTNPNGSHPNRNGNNSRRPNGDGDDNDDDDDDDDGEKRDEDEDDDDQNETDETIAHRLGFRPIDGETLRTIARLRNLTRRKLFDQRDMTHLQNSIDELIRLQHLENVSSEQLEKVIRYLKIYRAFRSKSRALSFMKDRLPARSIPRDHNESNSNVFNVWRERERRARLDSKDSLEDEGQSTGGQQLRDVTEINHPTPPVNLTNQSSGRSRVKQMARDIDTRTVPTRSNDHHRTYSPSPIHVNRLSSTIHEGVPIEISFNEQSETNRPAPTGTSSDQRRVRDIIDRLESSSTNVDVQKKIEDASSSPIFQRHVRQDVSPTNRTTEHHSSFIFHHRAPHDEIFVHRGNPSSSARFELNRDEIKRAEQRTTSGTTIDEYVTSLLPGTEASISMVRDVRARLYEDNSGGIQTNGDNVPMKVDVETLYILEQKAERKSLPSTFNIEITDGNRQSTSDRHDFAMQTSIAGPTIKPPHRPVGTQVDTTIEHHTVSAQTTDSLHWPVRERQRLPSAMTIDDGETSRVTTTTITTRYEVKRRHSSHHSSEEEVEDDAGGTMIFIDDRNETRNTSDTFVDDRLPTVPDQQSSFGHVSSKIRMDQLRDLNRHIVQRHGEHDEQYQEDQHRSSEVYEIHTRGACKCLVVSSEEKIQYGSETRFENQLQRIERTYTDEELRATELHVIVTNSDRNYELVRRNYGSNRSDSIENRQPSINIHYYSRDGQRMNTEYHRLLEHLPLFIRCEIEYELNHYGSAQLIILSVTDADRRQMSVALKKEIVDEVVAQSGGRAPPNCPQLQNEITRQLSESISILHLVDYSSRDDHNQTNSTDLRRVSRLDVTTSLRLVQKHRTVIHRLCQLHRSHLRLTPQAEQHRHLILVSCDEYYLFDLASYAGDFASRKTEYHQPQQVPFDYAKYRRETQAQQRVIEQRYQEQRRQQQQAHQGAPPPPGHPNEAEFYLGSGRRALIEREIHSMRESIRPHEHAPPQYKNEPRRRTVSISYSGSQRYVRARIIHVKDYYDDNQLRQQHDHKNAKEQELFVRVDDYINESAANSLRRSYSTDYLQEDGPRSRIRYIRIPGETIRIEEKTTYEYQGVMYTNLPYSLNYWSILQILDREAREGRPLGSTLPQIIVNDPYQTVIPPLTQQEIRQTAQQVLSPNYNIRSSTDQTLRWFLLRDNRTEIESSKYLQTLNQYRQQQHQNKRTDIRVDGNQPVGTAKKYYVTETLVRYEKMPDRLVPVALPDRSKSTDNIHQHIRTAQNTSQAHRSQSQSRTPQPLSIYRPGLSSASTANLSRHKSVNELHVPPRLSHPPSPSPSLHSLHSQNQSHHQRRPVSFNTRFQGRVSTQPQNPLFTEIIDSQTGRRIITTSQEQLPSEVLGLLNKYNLQEF